MTELISARKRRTWFLLIVLAVQLAACGFEIHLVHRDQALNKTIQASIHSMEKTISDLKEQTRQSEEQARQLEDRTERLRNLLKILKETMPDRNKKL